MLLNLYTLPYTHNLIACFADSGYLSFYCIIITSNFLIELTNNIGLEPKERLSRQQKLLRKRLGLDIAPGIDVGMDKLFDDEDLIVSAQEGKGKSLTKQKSFEVGKPQSS